jgi:hypothetical protein
MDLKGFGGMRQKLITPLVVLGLADLVLSAQFGHGLALEALEHDHGFGFSIPLAPLYWLKFGVVMN